MGMKWIDYETRPCSCGRKGEATTWKVLGVLGLLAAGVFAFLSFCLKRKSDRYRDALIDLSDQIPDDEDRRNQWQSAHAPANRKTVEERLTEQRVYEA